jgi:hypothetical protein
VHELAALSTTSMHSSNSLLITCVTVALRRPSYHFVPHNTVHTDRKYYTLEGFLIGFNEGPSMSPIVGCNRYQLLDQNLEEAENDRRF